MADEKAHVFSMCVKELLRTWPVLSLARQHGFGGKDTEAKEEWLCESIIQIFKDNDLVYPDELEEFVSEALYNEFDTIAEDGSLTEICTKICQYYEMCKKDQVAKVAEDVKKMQAINPIVEGKKQLIGEDEGSSSDDDDDVGGDGNEGQSTSNQSGMDVDMTDDTPTYSGSKEKEYDEDGWEVVRRKKR